MIERLFRRLNDSVDRRFLAVLAVLAIAAAATIVRQAQVKPLWHDEIYTVLAARLPLTSLWTASRDGLDLSPPFNTLLTHMVQTVAGEGRVVTRLPPLAGFLTAFVCIGVMARRRSNALIGVAAALTLCYSAAYLYAFEARGYGVLTGCFALALLMWSEHAAGRAGRAALVGLSIALAAGLWTHDFFVLAFLPIGCGELVRQWRRRRIDVPVWIAIAAALVAAAPTWVLLRAGLAQAASSWARLQHPGVWATYAKLLDTLVGSRFRAVAAATVVLIVVDQVRRRSRPRDRRLPVHEVVAGTACLAIPLCAVLIARTVGHDAFVPRYVMFATVGFALTIPIAIWRFAPRNGLVDVLVFGVLMLFFVRTLWRTFEPGRMVVEDRMAPHAVLVRQIDTANLTVVTGSTDFLELWYHTPPGRRSRLVYLADPTLELQETRTDAVDRGYLALARWSDVRVEEAGAFLAAHRDFALYDCGGFWTRRRLLGEGASFEELGRDSGGTLYRVQLSAR